MSSDSGPHFDDISDNDWPANDYVRGRASVFPRNKDIAHNEYDEARQLLRDLDRNYFTRHLERGFMTLFPNPDPDGEPFFDYEYPQTDYTDAPWIPPLSHVVHCPSSDYVRPSDGAASHAETDGFLRLVRPLMDAYPFLADMLGSRTFVLLLDIRPDHRILT